MYTSSTDISMLEVAIKPCQQSSQQNEALYKHH
uniref:Uncharacterized protein n=1 Tax=Rhizophora mucronata TaxID=61149 RepID=A0A2P2PE87_RHIMU